MAETRVDSTGKIRCPICGRRCKNLRAHTEAQHPEQTFVKPLESTDFQTMDEAVATLERRHDGPEEFD